jgi:Tfp pilus assembly PilM family ATPase
MKRDMDISRRKRLSQDEVNERIEKSFVLDFMTYMVEGEPNTYREAVTSSDGRQWKEAITKEIDSILQNYTWESS